MNRLQHEHEARLLERVTHYRQEYRGSRTAAVREERERRHANGEVYFAGSWVPRADAERIAQRLQWREYLAFFEIVALLAVMAGVAWGMCWLFDFLFLP